MAQSASVGSQSTAPPRTFKVAFYNVQGGNGEAGLTGTMCPFVESSNCTDPTKPLNAWGRGIVQAELVAKIGNDPAVVALGLAEAWNCATPDAVKRVLGWAARTSDRNGLAVVARYGFAGPEQWQQLDTSLSISTETKWLLRVPVCLDGSCRESINVFATHWQTGATRIAADAYRLFDIQTQQTIDFMAQAPFNKPHVLIGDLNVWDGDAAVCREPPVNAPARRMRDAGYLDAWRTVYGSAEGYTGMWNRVGCGVPEGYVWKRIDYALSGRLAPLTASRFGMVPAGQCAPSDHAGIVAEYGVPSVLVTTVPPTVNIQAPADGATVAGIVPVSVAAFDDQAVVRVELLVDGVTLGVDATSPFSFSWDSARVANGAHVLEAAATDASGNRTRSALRTINVRNPTFAGDEIVLHAAQAAKIVGNWTKVPDSTAASGIRLQNTDFGSTFDSPHQSPGSYAEFTFTPNVNRAYHLWLRGRAWNDSPANDSVHVQFEGAVDASGNPIYGIGTPSSAIVNLEDCGGCGLSAWGWQDNGTPTYVAGPVVYFATPGPRRLRIQHKEDGLGFDQIVLSAVAYAFGPPGALVNDVTILPATSGAATVNPLEIVLHTADGTRVGNWIPTADVTASRGIRLQNPNAGLPKLTVALAAPSHYFELTFQANANTPYRLWLRGKAEGDSYDNDSVHVQFDGSVDAAGQPIYRIGTTSSTPIVLEDCSGCGVQGWGWQDNGYGTGVLGPTIRFATSGPQRLRVQMREDGLGIDQIVLSASTFLTVSPGPPKNDATLLIR